MSTFKTAAATEQEAQFRQFLSYLFEQSTRGTAVTGVLESVDGNGLSVAQTATASGSVQVTSGAAVQQSSLLTGVSPLISNGVETVDVLGASPMGGLPRNDLIVFDSVTASIVAVIGTPNASPTDPTPANPSVPLARLRHPASATTIPNANIDDLRVGVTLASGQHDSQWQTVSTSGGFTAIGTQTPRVRKVGKLVIAEGGWTNGGMTINTSHNVGTIPDGFRPTRQINLPALGTTGNQFGGLVVFSSGIVQVRAGASLADNYNFPGPAWFVD